MLSIGNRLTMKLDFELKITWPSGRQIKSNKSFSGRKHNSIYRQAERWMQICLDICGKDENGVEYQEANLKWLKPEKIG